MSIVIGMNLGTQMIMASDARVTYEGNNSRTTRKSDEVFKLFALTPSILIGFATNNLEEVQRILTQGDLNPAAFQNQTNSQLFSLFQEHIKQIQSPSGFLWGNAQEGELYYYEVDNCKIVNSMKLGTGEVKVFGHTGIPEIDNGLECIINTTYRNLRTRNDIDEIAIVTLIIEEYTKFYRNRMDTDTEPYSSSFLVSARSDNGIWIAYDTSNANIRVGHLIELTEIEYDSEAGYGRFKVSQNGFIIWLRSIMEWDC
ncbi:hypothetical protein KAH81_10305 [bacterium]|nr:hypothetical protein [bacterium]